MKSIQGTDKFVAPQQRHKCLLVHCPDWTRRSELFVFQAVRDIFVPAHNGESPSGPKDCTRARQMSVGNYQSAEVEDAAVNLHLSWQASETIEIALQLEASKVVPDQRYVDSASVTNHKLLDQFGA
nr:hypothetical protein [uncultured Leifsonia sp.]